MIRVFLLKLDQMFLAPSPTGTTRGEGGGGGEESAQE